MRLDLTLDTPSSIALRRFAAERDLDLPVAAEIALRDWLIAHRYLELGRELDEETSTAGDA